MNLVQIGENINEAGRSFKLWFTDFTLVYSPIFIVIGLILTGIDLFLNLGLGNSLWFKLPWSIAQLFAVDGLWFALWNRILTDEYKKSLWYYHGFLIVLGLAMTGIAITMNYIIFTQDYMGLKDSVAAMNFVGISVSLFLFVRSVLLMATATLAIVLDKVMRSKPRYTKRSNTLPGKNELRSSIVPESHIEVTPVIEPTRPALLNPGTPEKSNGYKEQIKAAILRYKQDGTSYTYKDLVQQTGASLQTVKIYAPKIKKELEGN